MAASAAMTAEAISPKSLCASPGAIFVAPSETAAQACAKDASRDANPVGRGSRGPTTSQGLASIRWWSHLGRERR